MFFIRYILFLLFLRISDFETVADNEQALVVLIADHAKKVHYIVTISSEPIKTAKALSSNERHFKLFFFFFVFFKIFLINSQRFIMFFNNPNASDKLKLGLGDFRNNNFIWVN